MLLIDHKYTEKIGQKDKGKEWGKFVKCHYEGVVVELSAPQIHIHPETCNVMWPHVEMESFQI